jgi:hypothetical protein
MTFTVDGGRLTENGLRLLRYAPKIIDRLVDTCKFGDGQLNMSIIYTDFSGRVPEGRSDFHGVAHLPSVPHRENPALLLSKEAQR